jgi:hypothetical protein
MTGREHIAKRVRVVGILPIPLLVAIWVLPVFFPIPEEHRGAALGASLIAALIAAFIAAAITTVRIVCPYCSQWIGPILRFGKSPFVRGLPGKVKYCPLCGADFESELKDRSANNTSDGIRQPADGSPKPSR